MSPRTEALIGQRVERGEYEDAGAVVEEAPHVLDERAFDERLRVLIEEAEAEIARGEVAVWSPELFARLKREAAEAQRRGLPVSDVVG